MALDVEAAASLSSAAGVCDNLGTYTSCRITHSNGGRKVTPFRLKRISTDGFEMEHSYLSF